MTCEVRYCADHTGNFQTVTWRMDMLGLLKMSRITALLPDGGELHVERSLKDLLAPESWLAVYQHAGRTSPPLQLAPNSHRYAPVWPLLDRGSVMVQSDAWQNIVGQWFNVGHTADEMICMAWSLGGSDD